MWCVWANPKILTVAASAVEEQSSPPTVSRVWVAAVSAARPVWLRRELLVARVSDAYPSGSQRVSANSPSGA